VGGIGGVWGEIEVELRGLTFFARCMHIQRLEEVVHSSLSTLAAKLGSFIGLHIAL
jgi:hypothetical protein